ncbi:tRNA (adenosine(37)-N6)-dimethylallyltransferase MiaA [Lacihabitans sp. LS3-19]|uniref:tRNA (adenosine(37)-N6)-dimethylallyltransferase MiaA n=1 Tax=Lacihabitans sp. LS3-19 TaxID=2487335 RepID=UPI0020CF3E1C|nr:tRNA (adenosine(37)-N6)-dimethylallyltransferase MiaA [Lacihabitans sp. LS3-19]MCP9770822.1 tRNA (adenosine(37)-N6)-dimethylallyltransferase MiaA [Lacihabitans sp. LS3-19]
MSLVKNETELIVILGPTASGKTRLAVNLAAILDGEIISADSRQVYKGMDIGTGKDLSEYQFEGKKIAHHLIDICEAGEKYNVAFFQKDFLRCFLDIQQRGKFPILCGGTGLYIQSALSEMWQIQVPVDEKFRKDFETMGKDDLSLMLKSEDIKYDISTKKRLIRGLEIEKFLNENADFEPQTGNNINYKIFGFNPELNIRRDRISKRLKFRFENEGLLEEVRGLLESGLTFEMLDYYGLEYRYIGLFLKNEMSFEEMFGKLETEIHRYAKRQMTFFRSMERKGFEINWIPDNLDENEKLRFIIDSL